MKKFTFTILTILILTLTACASSAANQASPASGNQSGPATGELPATTQLILGTFKLEDTDQAVTVEQAAELLPLWQTLQVLSESDTAAQQETAALITQIQETMIAAQTQAITDMNLSREDMMSVMQGQASGQNSNSQNGNSSNNSGRNFGSGGMPPPDGGFPGGGPGMGSGGQGQNVTADQIATAQAARQAGGGNVVPPALINALIEFLKQKAGS